jgi:hypothetical protein
MINIEHLQDESSLQGDSDEDTRLLKQMAGECRQYLKSFGWCPPIANVYFGDGVGGVVAVFLVGFTQPIANSEDRFLWVIIGDLPSAYLATDCIGAPGQALEAYCSMMQVWVDAVNGNDGLLASEVVVSAEATIENARALQNRLTFLRTEILPSM